MIWRRGRKNPFTIYVQMTNEPLDSDIFVGALRDESFVRRAVEDVNSITELMSFLNHRLEVGVPVGESTDTVVIDLLRRHYTTRRCTHIGSGRGGCARAAPGGGGGFAVTERPSTLDTLVTIAQAWSRRGTCSIKQVGAIAALEERPIASGYNGTPAGMPHCEHLKWTYPLHDHWVPTPDWVTELYAGRPPGTMSMMIPGETVRLDRDGRGHEQVHRWGLEEESVRSTCPYSVHAEANMVAFAARYGIPLNNAEVVTTLSPCVVCARLLINAGIIRVYCVNEYRDSAGVDLLRDATIDVVML